MCQSLLDGEFRIINPRTLVTSPVPMLPMLPRLKRLVLHNMTTAKLESLPSTSLSAAEHFGLMSFKFSPEGFQDNIPICSTVKRLTVSMQPWKTFFFIQMLQKFEMVTSLTLCCVPGTKKLNAFLRDLASTPLLPHLTHYDLYVCVVKGFDFGSYEAIISDQWNVSPSNVRAKLEKCSLIFVLGDGCNRSSYELMMMQVRRLLKPLVDDGLEFTLSILNDFPLFTWSLF